MMRIKYVLKMLLYWFGFFFGPSLFCLSIATVVWLVVSFIGSFGSVDKAALKMRSSLSAARDVSSPRSSGNSVADAFETRFFDALHAVESGRRLDPPAGDGGRALGPLQIHRAYFEDAAAHNRARSGYWFDVRTRYEDVRYLVIARGVVRAYMDRYAQAAWLRGDATYCARVHNGGPSGARKRATDAYARRFAYYYEGGR